MQMVRILIKIDNEESLKTIVDIKWWSKDVHKQHQYLIKEDWYFYYEPITNWTYFKSRYNNWDLVLSMYHQNEITNKGI